MVSGLIEQEHERLRMAIPDFQSIMLPVLTFIADGQEHTILESASALADTFGLTDAERAETLSSGQRTFENRVRWAIVYMKPAGLLEYARRGVFHITERGMQVLGQNPARIDVKFLSRFPEFIAFRNGSRKERNGQTISGPLDQDIDQDTRQTPEERLEYGYQRIRLELAQELLARIMGCSPAFFERLVVELLVKMGYRGSRKDAGEAIGRSGDEGIDGIIKEDRLGLDTIYIQAKRWRGTVGRPDIQKFTGALMGQRARKGIFITTSDFSREAQEYAGNIESRIVLIDGEQLTQLMIDHDIGVSTASIYEIKKVDSDYFTEV
jgi:restriction system protein